MHALQAGDAVQVSAPSNNFPLEPSTKPIVLVAGGIGITPLHLDGGPVDGERRSLSHDLCRPLARATSPSQARWKRCAPGRLTLHTDDRAGLLRRERLDGVAAGRRAALSLRADADDRCGHCRARSELGWPKGRLHFEIFAAAAPAAGDQPFEVVLKQQRKELQ